jgi:hypothetical protein
MANIDLTELEAILIDQAQELLEGAAEDIRRYVAFITTDMARALLLPEPERLLQELAAQLEAVAEINRIRANEAAWRTFHRVVVVVSSILLKLA